MEALTNLSGKRDEPNRVSTEARFSRHQRAPRRTGKVSSEADIRGAKARRIALHYDFRLELDEFFLVGRCPRARRWILRRSAWPCTWKITPSSTGSSRVSSRKESTAAAL